MPKIRDKTGVISAEGTAAPALTRLEEDGLLVTGTDGILVDVNAAACGLTGYRRSELIGKTATSLVAPEWADFTARQRQRKVQALQEVTRYRCVFLTKGGSRLPVEVTSTLMRERGEVVGVRATVRDCSEAFAVEQRLQGSEGAFRGAFEGAAIGMAMVAPDGRWLKVNEALVTLLGFSREEMLELTFQDVTHPDDLERDLEAVGDVLAGRVAWYHMEKRYIRKDGTVLWGLLAVSLVRERDNEPAYFISQISDITAAKDAAAAQLAATTSLPEGHRRLSPREAQVLSLLADGYLTNEVSEQLEISAETVQTLVKRAVKKLGARNRTQAVVRAMELGWLHVTRSAAI